MESVFDLAHLLFVLDSHDLLDLDDLLAQDTVLLHDLRRVHALLDHQELLTQLLDLVLVLTQEGVLRVLIDTGLVQNVLGAGSVTEGVHSLVIVVVCRAHVGNHNCFRVTTKGVLEETGKLRVTIGDVG